MPIVYSQPVGEIQEIKKSSLMTTLPTLRNEWEISFEFKPANYEDSRNTNILHLTFGGDKENPEDRIPAIFYHPGMGLHVKCDIGKDQTYHTDIMPPPPVGQWSTIVLSQITSGSTTIFSVKVGGASASTVETLEPLTFSSVMVFASDPWMKAQPGAIRGLTINTQ